MLDDNEPPRSHTMVATPPTVEWWLARLRYQHQLYLTQERNVNTRGIAFIKHALYSTWCDLAEAAELAKDDTALDRGKVILTSKVAAKGLN